MAGNVIAEALVRVGADTSGFGKDVEKGTKGPLSKVGSTIGKTLKRGLQVGAVAVAEFGRESVKAFTKAEEAESKFNLAIEKFPKLADVSRQSLVKLAQATSLKTKFSKADVETAEAQLAAFGVTGKQLQKLLPLLTDYAARTGKDLPAAATTLGKALLGNFKALKSIGIVIPSVIKSTGDAGAAQKKLAAATQALTFLEERQAAKKKLTIGDHQALIIANQRVAEAQDAVNASLKKGAPAASNFETLVGALTKTVGGFAEKEGKTAAGQLAILGHGFQQIQEQVGAKLAPIFTTLLKAIKPLLPVFGKLVTSLANALAPALKILVKSLTSLIPLLAPLVKAFGKALSGALGKILPILIQVVAVIVKELAKALPGLLPSLLLLVDVFVDLVVALLPLLPILVKVAAVFIRVLAPIIAKFAPLILLVVAGIKLWTIAQAALNIVMNLNPIGLLVIAIAALIAIIIVVVHNFDTIKRAATIAFNTVKRVVLGAVSDVLGFLRRNWPLIVAILTGPIGLAVLFIQKNFNKIVDFFKKLPGRIAGFFGSVARTVFNFGKSILEGLLDGFKAAGRAILNRIPGILKRFIPDAIKRFFGISSPSKLMMKIGAQVGQGFNIGLLDSLGQVDATTKLTGILGQFPDGMATAGAGGTGTTGGTQITNNITTASVDPRVLANELSHRMVQETLR